MPNLFDLEEKKKTPATQKVKGKNLFEAEGSLTKAPTTSKVQGEEPSFLSKAGSFLGNAAKEAVVAPIRGALKYSVGAVAQGVNELATGKSLQELNVPIIGNIAPLGNKDAEGKRIAPVRYLAEAGETALEIGTAALGGTVVKSLAKGGLKAGVKQAAKVALFDSAVGAAYGATTSLQDPEATPESVATGTALGAGIGLVLPPVAGKTIEAGLKLGGGLIRQGANAVEKTALGLEKYAGKELINPLEKIGVDTTKVKGLFDSVSPEVSDQTFMQKIAETTAKGIRELQKAPERVAVGFNRLRQVSQLQETEAVRENMAKLGIDANLADKQQRVNNVALFKGQEYQKNYVDSVYKPMENEAERYYLSTYIQHLDAMDNVAKGKQVAGGYSPEEATKRFYEFRDSMKELGILEKLKAQQAKHVEFWDKILRDGVDSGRISEESYANIKKDHPNYMPNFKINEDGELISETGEALGATSAEKLKFKSRKGSARENLDPVEATLTKIMNETYKNEKAKADKVFFDSIKGIEEKVGIKVIQNKEQVDAMTEVYKELSTLRQERKALENALSKEENIDRKITSEMNKKIKDLELEEEKLRKDFEQYFSLEAKKVPSLEFPKEVKPNSKLLSLRESSKLTEEKLNKEFENYFSKQTSDEFLQTSEAKALPRLRERTLEKIKVEEKQLEKKLGDLSYKLSNTRKEILRSEDKLKKDLSKKIFSKEKRMQREALNNLRSREKALEKEMSISRNKLENLRKSISTLTNKKNEANLLMKLLESSTEKTKSLQKDFRNKLEALRPDKIASFDIPKDMVKVSRLNQGVKEEYLMPKYLGRAISGLGSDQIEGWMRVLTGTALGRALIAPTKALRSVATTFNPGFVLANYMRDIQTAGMMANPSSPLKLSAAKYIVGDIIDGFKNALFRNNPEKNELYRQAGAKGLFFDSFFDADTTEGIYKSILGKKKILGATMDPKTLSPLKAIGEAGRILEQTTRLAVFRNSLRRGLTPEQAVKEAANATVDFGKRGDISTLLNQVIPFFNAGAQGTINLANTIAKNPTEFSRRAFYMGAIPTAMTYAHNRGYESYKNIPDWEKHMYWIVMVSEMPGKNYRGEDIMIPNYIKIPKGIPQQLISTPIESFFKQIDGQEPETLSQLLRFIGSRTSPISFDEGLGGGGFGDLAKAVGSSAMPLIVKYPAELMTNYSFFKGKAIVPDYVYKKEKDKWMKSEELPPEERFSSGSESAAGKMIGEVLGLSPLQIDYMIKTGGLKDLVWTLDLGLKTEADRSAKKDMLRRDLTPVETLSEIPVLRTFFGSSAYGQEQKQREKEKLEAQSTNKRLLEYLRSE